MGIRTWTLLAAMMVLLATTALSEDCPCFYYHPQSYFCETDLVIKGQFLSVSERTDPTGFKIQGYNIKVKEIFKGNNFQDIIFVANQKGTFCEYKHGEDFSNDYVIPITRITSADYYVDSCYFIRLWSTLSSGQRKGFHGAYAEECRCRIRPCYTPVCFPLENECAFNPSDVSARQWNQICVQNEHGNCAWEDPK